jgi:purine-binding chemotaxis protein CheW
MTPRKKAEPSSGAAKKPASGAAKKPASRSKKPAGSKAAAKKPAASKATPKTPEPEQAEVVESATPVDDAVRESELVDQSVDATESQAPAADEQSEEAGQDEHPVPDLLADKMVAFYLSGQRYAFPIVRVQEIQQIVEFSEIPSQGGPVVGMVNLRGAVIPALDMRVLVGLERRDYALETPMIICRSSDQLVAMIVDEVEDVLTMPDGCLQAPPRMHALGGKMIGVCRLDSGLVYLLDVEEILAPVSIPT